jgi:hypothetical protein
LWEGGIFVLSLQCLLVSGFFTSKYRIYEAKEVPGNSPWIISWVLKPLVILISFLYLSVLMYINKYISHDVYKYIYIKCRDFN